MREPFYIVTNYKEILKRNEWKQKPERERKHTAIPKEDMRL